MIPTYEECVRIVANNAAFDHTRQDIDGMTVHNFGYNLPGLMDFERPIKDETIDAYELRGISFVEENGIFHGPYLMLDKFWCLNQTKGAMYDDVKDQCIIRAQDKLDGSVIRFIRLPNGRIIAKSKGAIQNPHTTMAEMLLHMDSHLMAFVKQTLDAGQHAIFELIGPEYKVVLEYETQELRLLQVRDENGIYIDIREIPQVRDGLIKTSRFLDITTWEQVLEFQRTQRGVEGIVVTLPNRLLKIKTDWYENMHRHFMEKDYSDKAFVEMTLDETMDDALAATDPNSAVYHRMTFISTSIGNWFNNTLREVDTIMQDNRFDPDDKQARGTFARNFNKHPLFDFLIVAMQVQNAPRSVVINDMKKVVRRMCKNHDMTRKFIDRITKTV